MLFRSAQVYGAASYYEEFRFDPPAAVDIRWCSGPACRARNGGGIRDAILATLGVPMDGQTEDGRVGVRLGQCIGTCELAPQVWIEERATHTNEIVGPLNAARAIRIARAATGRDDIVKIEGSYHGHHDPVMFSVVPNADMMGGRDAPHSTPMSLGIPASTSAHTHVVPFNDLTVLRRLLEERGDSIACLILEPVMMNIGICQPQPGYLQGLKDLLHEFGALLIFDEVKTGFRFGRGGAAEYFGITPDLATYAKAMGNGYPAAAFAGTDEVMSVLPDKVSHGGTYAGNRVAASAAWKTLEIIRDTKQGLPEYWK